MDGDLGTLAAAALGIAVSPVPLVLALALLGSARPVRTAGAFVSGEAFAIAAIAALAVFVLADAEGDTTYARGLHLLEVLVGLLLAALVVVQLRRPRARGAGRWSRAVDRVGVPGAFAGGMAMVALNPKNLALTLAGSAAIVRLAWSPGGQAAGVVTFTAAGVSILALLVLALTLAPDRARAALGRAEPLLDAYGRVLVGGALLVLALYFLLHGVTGLRG